LRLGFENAEMKVRCAADMLLPAFVRGFRRCDRQCAYRHDAAAVVNAMASGSQQSTMAGIKQRIARSASPAKPTAPATYWIGVALFSILRPAAAPGCAFCLMGPPG
jgi:hypothetical protein